MNATEPISIAIEFVKQQVDPGGGGGSPIHIITPAKTGDVLIFAILSLLFVAIIAYCLLRIHKTKSNIVSGKIGNDTAIGLKRMTIWRLMLVISVIACIFSFAFTSINAIAQAGNNSYGFEPDKIQVVINEETGQATCDPFKLVNNSENSYLFESSTLELSDDAKSISTENDWDLTIDAVDLGSYLFDGQPGNYTIPLDKIKPLEPQASSAATLTFNKIDVSIANQLIGKQVFNLALNLHQNIAPDPEVKKDLIYNGEAQTGVEPGEGFTLTDNTKTDAGDYVAIATLEPGYTWSDYSTSPKEISWSIAKAVVTEIDIKGNKKSFTYDGNPHTFPNYAAGDLSYEVTGFTMKEGHSESVFDASKILPLNNTPDIKAVMLTEPGLEYLNLDTYSWTYNDSNVEVQNDSSWKITDGYLQINEFDIVTMNISFEPAKVLYGDDITYTINLKNNTENEITGGVLLESEEIIEQDITIPVGTEGITITYTYKVSEDDIKLPEITKNWTFTLPNLDPPYTIYQTTKTPIGYNEVDIPVISDITFDTYAHEPFKELEGIDVKSGSTKETNAGQYSTKVVPQLGYCWRGTKGDRSERTINWNILKAVVTEIDITGNNKDITYDGNPHTFPNYNAGETSYEVTGFKMKDGHSEKAFDASKIFPPNNTLDINPVTRTAIGVSNLGLDKYIWGLNDPNVDAQNCRWNITDGYLQIKEVEIVSMEISFEPEEVSYGDEITYTINLKNNIETEISGGVLRESGNIIKQDITIPVGDKGTTITYPYNVSEDDIKLPEITKNWTFELPYREPPFVINITTTTPVVLHEVKVPVIDDITFDNNVHKPFEELEGIAVKDGSTEQKNAGEYATVVVPKVGYCWENTEGDISERTIDWKIEAFNIELGFDVDDDGYTVEYGDEWTTAVDAVIIYKPDVLPEPIKDIFPGGLSASCDYVQGDPAGSILDVTINEPSHNDNYTVSKNDTTLTVEKRDLTIIWDESTLKVQFDGGPQWPGYAIEGAYNLETPIITLSAKNSLGFDVEAPIEIGKYSITATLSQDDINKNYNLLNTKDNPTTCDFEIQQVKDRLLLAAPDSTELGLLEYKFMDSGYNPLHATSVEFKYSKDVDVTHARNFDKPIDMSQDQKKYILGYVMDDQTANSYKLTIVCDTTIKANTNSLSRMFKNFRNLYSIDYSNLDTSIVEDATYMFEGTGRDDVVMGEINFNTLKNGKLVFAPGCDVSHMFDNCNCSVNLTNLDTTNISSMDYMFYNYCKVITSTNKAPKMPVLKFSDSEDGFVIPKNCSTYHMFDGCSLDLSPVGDDNVLDQIDFSNATNLSGMFSNYGVGKDEKVLNLENVDMSSAESMSEMFAGTFYGVGYSTIIFPESFKLAKDVSGMFKNCTMYVLDLSNLNFSQVNNMSHFFDNYGFKEDLLEDWGIIWPEDGMSTSENCDASYMFANASIFPSVLSKWNPSKITNMEGFFYNYGMTLLGDIIYYHLQDIYFPEGYKVAANCSLHAMFKQAYCNVDLSNFDASEVKDFSNMFESFGSIGYDSENSKLFSECVLNFGDDFKTAEGANFSHMFDAIQILELDLSKFNMNNGADFSYMFQMVGQNLNPLLILDYPVFTCKITFPSVVAPTKRWYEFNGSVKMDHMFHGFRYSIDEDPIYALDISGFDFTNVSSMVGMFSWYCSIADTVYPHVESDKNLILPETITAANNADMSYMFEHSNAYTNVVTTTTEAGEIINTCILKVKAENVKNASHMFDSTFHDLTHETHKFNFYRIDLSELDWSNIDDITYMFYNAFYRDVNRTEKAFGEFAFPESFEACIELTSASHLFDGACVDNLDIEWIDFTNITDLSYCFANLGSEDYPVNINDIFSFTIGKATTVGGLFYNSYIANMPEDTLDLKGWDVSQVTDLSYLFYNLRCVTLDISTWNPEKCTNMEGMFMGFGNYELMNLDEVIKSKIIFPKHWTTGKDCSMKYMFESCLADVDLSGFDVSKVSDMEGMFFGYGTSLEQLLNVLDRIISSIKNGNLEEDGSLNVYALAENLVSKLIDEKAGEYINNTATASQSLVDSRISLGKESLSRAVAETNNKQIGSGLDDINATNARLDLVSNDNAYNDVFSDADFNAENYASDFYEDFNEIKSESISDINNALVGLLEGIDLNKFNDNIRDVLNDMSVPNVATASYNITFTDRLGGFNPGSDTTSQSCSMRGMFALCNFVNFIIPTDESDRIANHVPLLTSFDTSHVNDMSFMFAGYYLASVIASYNEEDEFKLNISSFNTSNVRNMTGMFLLSGLFVDSKAGSQLNIGKMNIVFGRTFKINSFDNLFADASTCKVAFMFTGCFANLEYFNEIDTSNAKDLSFMFIFANIGSLDISEWDTSNVKDMKYMFAFYGSPGYIVEAIIKAIKGDTYKKTVYSLNIGSADKKFVIGPNCNVNKMFILPAFSQLDLKNVDTSTATNLMKMFDFCIMYSWLIDDKPVGKENCGIDISTWTCPNVTDFSNMFRLVLTHKIQFPSSNSKFKTGQNASAHGMFKFAFVDNLEKNEYSDKVLSFDISGFDLTNLSNASEMFKGFDLLGYLFYSDAKYHLGSSINFGEQNISNCNNMDRMFQVCPMGVDMSKVTLVGLEKAGRMFAFSGYNYFNFGRSVPGRELALLTLGAYFTEIKLPTDIDSFKTIQGATTEYMFLGSKSGDLSKLITWDTALGTQNSSLTFSLTPSKIDFRFFQTKNVVNMKGTFMFYSGSLNLSNLDMSSCSNAYNMFCCYGLINVVNMLLANSIEITIVNIMELFPAITWPEQLTINGQCRTDFMFTQYMARPTANNNEYIHDFKFMNVSNLKRFDYMFAYGFGIYNYDLSNWDMSSATSLNHMFQGHGLLLTIVVDGLATFSSVEQGFLSKLYQIIKNYPVANMKMFNLPEASSSSSNETISMVGVFSWATVSALKVDDTLNAIYLDKTLDLTGWDFANVRDASFAFAGNGLGFMTGAALVTDLVATLIEYGLWPFEQSQANAADISFKLSFPSLLFNTDKVKFANGAIVDGMFTIADASVDLSALDTTGVASLDSMFSGYAPSFSNSDNNPDFYFHDKDVRKIQLKIPNNLQFDNPGGTSLHQMFMSYHPDSLDVSGWNTSNVTDLTRTFAYCNSSTLDVYNWSIDNCTSLEATFAGSTVNCIDMSNWNFSKVTSMNRMFAFFGNDDGRSIVYFPVTGMITAPNCSADFMFYSCRLTSILLYGLNIDNISSVDFMFTFSSRLERIHVSTSVDWTQKRLAGTYMFLDCYKLVGSNGTAYMNYHTNIEFARTDKGDKSPGYFSTTHSLREPNNYDPYDPAKKDSDYKSIFLADDDYPGFTEEQLKNVTKVVFSTGDPSKITDNVIDISWTEDKSIVASLKDNIITVVSEGIIYSRQKSLVNMFNWENSSLNNIDFRGGLFDTIASDSTYGMFAGCTKLQWIKDINMLNTLNVTNMSSMFERCGADYEKGCCVDFGVLSDIENISSWTSNFKTTYVTDMSSMFKGSKVCSSWIDDSLCPLNLITFDVSNVINLSHMFDGFMYNTVKFSDEKASFAPRGKCDFTGMFANSNYLEYLDLAGFKIPENSTLNSMFEDSKILKTIYVGADFEDTNNWSVIEGCSSAKMFDGCIALEGDKGTVYTDSSVDATYARPDNKPSANGYFSTTVKLDMSEIDIDIPTIKTNVNYELNINFIKNYNLEAANSNKASNIIGYLAPDSPIVVYWLENDDLENPQVQLIFASNQNFLPCDKKDKSKTDDDVLTCEDMFHKGILQNIYLLITKITIDNIDFTGTTSTKNMFSNLLSMSKLYFYNASGDLSTVNDATSMFEGCISLTSVDVTYWNLSTTAHIDNMFDGCSSLKTIYSGADTNWSENPCGDGVTVFNGCVKLVGNGWCTYNPDNVGRDMARIADYDTTTPGYFTHGALLMNYNEWTDRGVMEYAMEKYYENHRISFIGRLAYDVADWFQKQLVTSIDFYMDFEESDDCHKGYDVVDDDHRGKIDISQNQDGSVFAYVYSYYSITCPERIVKIIPFLRNVSIPLFRVAISTPKDNSAKQIIADTESLKYMFRGFNFIDWSGSSDGWNGVNFSKDVPDPSVFQIFNTSAARSAKGMFMDTYSFGLRDDNNPDYIGYRRPPDLDLTNLDTSSVNDFSYMFWHCQVGKLYLSTAIDDTAEETSKFSIANATNLSRMFESFGRLSVLSTGEWEESITGFIIDFATKLYLPKNMKTNNMCDASYMFYFTHILDIDVTRLNFDNFYNMDCMFSFAGAFRLSGKIFTDNIDHIPYEKLKEFALDLEAGNAQKCEEWYMNYLNSNQRTFGDGFCSVITFNQTEGWGPKIDCSAVEMFRGCTCNMIYADRFDTKNITNMRGMFQLMPFVKYIFVDNRNTANNVYWNTSKVEDMSEMFSYCGSIDGTSRFGILEGSQDPEIPGDFPTFEIKKDCKVGGMFAHCNLPVNLENCVCADNPNSFGLNNIKDYANMFLEYAYFALPEAVGRPDKLTIKLCTDQSVGDKKWTPISDASMYQMFRGCKANVDLSRLDTSKVNDFGNMFMSFGNGDEEVFYSNVGITFPPKFVTAENANMSGMFKGYKGFGYAGDGTQAPDFSIFDTSKVVNMSEMFRGCKLHSLDLSKWDTSKVRDFSYMFSSSLIRESYVEKITLGEKFKVDAAVDLTCMFGSDIVENDILRTIECPIDWATNINTKRQQGNVVWTDSMFAGCYKLVGNVESTPTIYDLDYLDHSLAKPGYTDSSKVHHRGYFTCYTYKPTSEVDGNLQKNKDITNKDNKAKDKENVTKQDNESSIDKKDSTDAKELDAGEVKEIDEAKLYETFKEGLNQSGFSFVEPIAPLLFVFYNFFTNLFSSIS